jgi:hypothetical protein
LRLWVLHDEGGTVRISTGYELSENGALIRSVAVDGSLRMALWLGQFALDQASAEGAHGDWLFSRLSGLFW